MQGKSIGSLILNYPVFFIVQRESLRLKIWALSLYIAYIQGNFGKIGSVKLQKLSGWLFFREQVSSCTMMRGPVPTELKKNYPCLL